MAKKKRKKIKNKVGRPSKKSTINLPKLIKLCLAGCTQKQIAIAFDVCPVTIFNYMKSDEQFLNTIKSNAELANAMVKASLWQRATGYSHPDVHISNFQGKTTITPIIKYYAPDPVSMIFWLTNREPENWKRGLQEGVSKELMGEEIELIPAGSNGKGNGNGNGKGKIPNRISKYLG